MSKTQYKVSIDRIENTIMRYQEASLFALTIGTISAEPTRQGLRGTFSSPTVRRSMDEIHGEFNVGLEDHHSERDSEHTADVQISQRHLESAGSLDLFIYTGGAPASAYPLGRCEGDCDVDTDCEGDLICFQRNRYDAVPGCNGGVAMWSVTDFCTIATEAPTRSPSDYPTVVGSTVLYAYPGDPPMSAYPLPLCTGDCDSDDDCAEGLECYSRTRYEEVPGCSGGKSDWSLTDYCAYPVSSSPSEIPSDSPSSDPSPSPVAPPTIATPSATPNSPSAVKALYVYNGVPPPSAYPLGLCEGDCNTDSDCEAGLVCFQREHYDAVPGCSGGESMYSRADFCVYNQTTLRPTSAPTGLPAIFAYEDVNPPDEALPLDLCEGDCDTDMDCGEGLYCYERSGGEDVPGCKGGAEDASNRDYCTHIEYAPVVPSNSTYFRFKLASQGTDWCIDCQNECTLGDLLYLRQCSGRSTYFELELLGFGETLIKVSGTETCLERRNGYLSLYACNSGKTRQRFVAADESEPFSTEYFEMTQNGVRNYCVSPSAATFASSVEMRNCTAARMVSASQWTMV